MEHADVMYGVTMPERGISKSIFIKDGRWIASIGEKRKTYVIKREKKVSLVDYQKKIGDVFFRRASIDEELFDELEEVLITSDIGMETTICQLLKNLEQQ